MRDRQETEGEGDGDSRNNRVREEERDKWERERGGDSNNGEGEKPEEREEYKVKRRNSEERERWRRGESQKCLPLYCTPYFKLYTYCIHQRVLYMVLYIIRTILYTSSIVHHTVYDTHTVYSSKYCTPYLSILNDTLTQIKQYTVNSNIWEQWYRKDMCKLSCYPVKIIIIIDIVIIYYHSYFEARRCYRFP